VRDLFVPMEIIGHPTIREADGLAMSSRNAYLSPEERTKARAIPTGLASAVRAFAGGERSVAALVRAVRNHVDDVATSVDYVTCADATSVTPLPDDATTGERVVLAVALRIGKTRLIDNVVLGEERGPGGETGMTPF